MATIRTRKRKDGTTAYTVRWREGGNGTETSETLDDQRAAELLRDYLNANGQSYTLASTAYSKSRASGPTLAELLKTHLDGLTGITPRTKADYARDASRHILPHIGTIRAGQLTRADVKAWVNKLATSGAAPKSIANYHGLLSAIMNTGIETGVRADNPCKGVRLPKRDRRGDRRKFMEPEEYAALLEQVPDHWQPLVQTLAGTGARWGEATALLVGDVVFDAPVPYIIIDKAWKRDDHNGYYVDRPKTERANREVTISASLAATLRELTKDRQAGDYLFTDEQGRPVVHRRFFRDVWKPSVDKAMATGRLRYRVAIHGLRHSSASWLLAAGVDMFTVQRRLGHESITTTTATYGHLSVRSEKLAADAMDKILG